MNGLQRIFNSLCTPAQLYLGLSILSILGMCFQNMGNPTSMLADFGKPRRQ